MADWLGGWVAPLADGVGDLHRRAGPLEAPVADQRTGVGSGA